MAAEAPASPFADIPSDFSFCDSLASLNSSLFDGDSQTIFSDEERERAESNPESTTQQPAIVSTPNKPNRTTATTPLTKSKLCQVAAVSVAPITNPTFSDDDDDEEDEIFFGAVTSKECLKGIQIINEELTTSAPVPVAYTEPVSVPSLNPSTATLPDDDMKVSAVPAPSPSVANTLSTTSVDESIPNTSQHADNKPTACVGDPPLQPPPATKLPTRIARPSRLRAPQSRRAAAKANVKPASRIAICNMQDSDDAVVASVLKELKTHTSTRPKPATESAIVATKHSQPLLASSTSQPAQTASSAPSAVPCVRSSELPTKTAIASTSVAELPPSDGEDAIDPAVLAALSKADPKAAAKAKAAHDKQARLKRIRGSKPKAQPKVKSPLPAQSETKTQPITKPAQKSKLRAPQARGLPSRRKPSSGRLVDANVPKASQPKPKPAEPVVDAELLAFPTPSKENPRVAKAKEWKICHSPAAAKQRAEKSGSPWSPVKKPRSFDDVQRLYYESS
eukprot:m.107072 g.107072  ORF g.107072 m.107072 type:complete len:508 (-) comp15304_c0_seq85:25-1548(-)